MADLGSAGRRSALASVALVVGWTVYDLLCRSPLGQRDLAVRRSVMFAVPGRQRVSCSRKYLSGRAAYIHVGAMIGTMMVANVLMLIIPGQRKMVAAMMAGQKPDPIHGLKAKQRSVHNNYFTLPVLFIMISNHYAMTYRHEHAWAVLAGIMAGGRVDPPLLQPAPSSGRVEWKYPAAGVALLLALAIALAPKAPVASAAQADPAAQFAQVQTIIAQRCASCHAAHPTQPGFATAPAGVLLDSAAQIHQNAPRIYQQAVQLKAMPLANLTNITDAERAQLGAWFEAGAK